MFDPRTSPTLARPAKFFGEPLRRYFEIVEAIDPCPNDALEPYGRATVKAIQWIPETEDDDGNPVGSFAVEDADDQFEVFDALGLAWGFPGERGVAMGLLGYGDDHLVWVVERMFSQLSYFGLLEGDLVANSPAVCEMHWAAATASAPSASGHSIEVYGPPLLMAETIDEGTLVRFQMHTHNRRWYVVGSEC